jgi:hypothetical protein
MVGKLGAKKFVAVVNEEVGIFEIEKEGKAVGERNPKQYFFCDARLFLNE